MKTLAKHFRTLAHLSAEEGHPLADITKRTLATLRAEDQFELFWEKVRKMTSELGNLTSQEGERFYSVMKVGKFQLSTKGYYYQIFYETLI